MPATLRSLRTPFYPTEVDARLAREAAWTPEGAAAELPYTRPFAGAVERE